MRRLTIEQVKQEFKREHYTLLSTEYENNHTMLDYICSEGHKNPIVWSSFARGTRCPDCAGNKKYDEEQVRVFFEKEGYRLSSKYTNNWSKLEYQCPEGHVNTVRWIDFKRGTRCSECAGVKRHTTQQIKKVIESYGYGLLSQYKNAYSKIELECPNGHVYSVQWNCFQQGQRCPVCREWKGEKKLGELLEKIFPSQVQRQDNLGFLGQQKVDFSVRDLNLAFEYDGLQHSQPVCFRGIDIKRARKNFILQQERDSRKNKICQENGYQLVRFAHDENIDEDSVEHKIGLVLCHKNP